MRGTGKIVQRLRLIVVILMGSAFLAACNSSSTQEKPGFSLALSSDKVSLAQGRSNTVTISINSTEAFTDEVTLGLEGLPEGVTGEFEPNPTSSSSTLVLEAGSEVAVGTAKITVRGSSGSISNTAQLELTITEGAAALVPPSFQVDPELVPAIATLPGFEVNETRPVAAVTDDKGNQAEFVADELWLSTSDLVALEDFLNRWDGKVLLEFNPVDYNLAGLDPQYLIRVNTSSAEVAELAEDLRALDLESRGEHRVSSEAGLALLAAGASEAAEGLDVGVNWIGLGDNFRDRASIEALSGPPIGGTAYTSNVFDWPSHNAGSIQDIGVTEAWRALELAGKLDNKVRIAVLDGGFAPVTNGDFPTTVHAASWVPFADAIGSTNPSGCSGGAPCPWHGTSVVNAAAGLADNTRGGAGPAGPVAELIVEHLTADFFISGLAIADARANGAKVINMSFSARVPASLSWSVWPFDAMTSAARLSGALLFASAGNGGDDGIGDNVDAEDCVFVCWEEAWHTPCENTGVVCVGSLGWNSKEKAGYSNFGTEEVDIFAPGTLWVGIDPSTVVDPARRNTTIQVDGTSFASPYAAGVAALIWAAAPGLSVGQVEEHLFQTAHSSPDSKVRRYVNAQSAVREAIGSAAPFIEITSPSDGASFSRGAPVLFEADAEDLEDGPLSNITWTSNLESGPIGTGARFSRNNLSTGTHTITASVTDSTGRTSTDTVTVTITNDPPSVEIVEPPVGADPFCANSPITFRARVTDINNPPDLTLPDSSVTWRIQGGSNFATGKEVEHSFEPGGYTVIVRATDEEGLSDEASINITVENCPGEEPTVRITNPPADTSTSDPDFAYDGFDEAKGMWFTEVTLSGEATDFEDGVLTGSALVWTTNRTDLQAATLGTGTSINVRLYSNACTGVWHEITLTATDSDGNTQPAVRSIFIWTLC